MSRWTEEQLRNYTARRLKSESRARERMIAKARTPAKGTRYNTAVVLAWFKECGLPEPVPEYHFDLERKWRFDFAWPEVVISQYIEGQDFGWHRYALVALEVQGGLFSGGAHVRGAALLREYEKLNRAAVLGWRVMFTTPQDLCTKDLADQIRQALAL